MTHDELVKRMREAWHKVMAMPEGAHQDAMAAALDVAVGELLGDPSDAELSKVEHSWIFDQLSDGIMYRPDAVAQKVRDAACIFNSNRRSRYLKPKSDPAVEAVRRVSLNFLPQTANWKDRYFAEIVAVVRAADRGEK